MGRSVTVCVRVPVCMYVTNFRRRRTSSLGAVLIAPLNCWRNSTPFWCKASLCMIKIDNFRTYHMARAYLTLDALVYVCAVFRKKLQNKHWVIFFYHPVAPMLWNNRNDKQLRKYIRELLFNFSFRPLPKAVITWTDFSQKLPTSCYNR